jgi:hypothetical protein
MTGMTGMPGMTGRSGDGAGGGVADIVSVHGGMHGVAAAYERMRSLADRYDASGDLLRELATRAGRAAVDPDLLESAVLSPVTAVAAEQAIVAATAGPGGLLVEALAWQASAGAGRGAGEALAGVDDAQAAAWDALDQAIGWHLGTLLAGPVGVAVVGTTALGLSTGLISTADLEALATEHPWLVEHLANGGDGLVGGLLPLGPVPLPPGTLGVEGLLASAYPDGTGAVSPYDGCSPITESPVTGQPESMQGLLGNLEQVAGLSQGPDSPQNGTIVIQTVTSPTGEQGYIVYVPGTDDMTTTPWTADDDVRDMGNNLALAGGLPDDYTEGITAAMAQHGIGPDDPVMIVGHSQGGMAAVAIAAQGDHHVTHVVTAGSPTAQVGGYPSGTQVLSIEQQGDIVPTLDGQPNPDLPNQTTVVIDAHPGPGAVAHHDHPTYVAGGAAIDAAVGTGAHPSLDSWAQSAHQQGYFGAGPSTSQTYQIVRAPGRLAT